MDKINISPQKKITISCGSENQTVEIGRNAVESGLLKKLPEPGLSIFLYLITHLEDGNFVLTNPSIIAGFLPYNIAEVKKGLNFLARHDIINVSKKREGDYTYHIYINMDRLSLTDDAGNDIDSTYNEKEIRQYVMRKNSVSKEELSRALASFVPHNKNTAMVRDDINHWLADFEPELLQELIRRVEKWNTNYNYDTSSNKSFYYLQGIIDDWYEKEIFTYDRLKYFDRLFRETRELAAAYGINKWQNVDSTQMQTFKSWLTGSSALSINVAKYAVREAIKRKKDGQPSLKYIEDNFIIPWKKAGIKNVKEATHYLSRQNTRQIDNGSKQTVSSRSKKKTVNKKYKWEDFFWNFDDFKET